MIAHVMIAHVTARAALLLAEKDTEFDPNTVSPGVGGFLAFAGLGVGVIVLGFLLVSRLRRNQYRYEVREQIAAEQAEAARAEAASAGDVAPASDAEGTGEDRAAGDPDSEPRN